MARIVCLGEAMVELSGGGQRWSLGYGGDTLNTAIHLARYGHEVSYLTALGDDPFSRTMRDSWLAEGLDCTMVLNHPSRHVGLYAISNNEAGERSFTYWRDDSAAREMFALPEIETALKAAGGCDLLYFSLISLAILPADARERLLSLARTVRASGGQVAFDGNYRARLWASREAAIAARDEALSVAAIGLPTLDDERELAADAGADAAGVAGHWRALGCDECVVKLGADGCRLPDGTNVAPKARFAPVDTSGAGDAFNAGYLASRLSGEGAERAARSGNALAGWVIMRPGAIPPRDGDAPYA